MKLTMAGLGLAFALTAACGGAQHPNTSAPTCADAAAQLQTELTKAMDGDGDDAGTAIHDVSLERCTADHWSADAIACVVASNHDQMPNCAAKLTPAQHEAFMNAVGGMMHDHERTSAPAQAAPAPAAASKRAKPPSDPCGGGE